MDALYVGYLIALTLFGLVFGSFANVLVWRIPRDESIVSPGSRCPSCGKPIRWYDNVPVLSWVILRARCRDCGEPISVRYPLVELLSGALWLAAGLRFGISGETLACVVLFYLLLVLSFIDLDVRRLPDVLVAPLAASGAAAVVISSTSGVRMAPLVGLAESGTFASPWIVAVTGLALGAGLSGASAWIYGAIRKRQGLGMGDIKLLGAMGLFTGPYILLVLFSGSLLGALAGVVQARRTGEGGGTMLPFGPFLAAGCVIAVLWGPAIWAGYSALVGLR